MTLLQFLFNRLRIEKLLLIFFSDCANTGEFYLQWNTDPMMLDNWIKLSFDDIWTYRNQMIRLWLLISGSMVVENSFEVRYSYRLIWSCSSLFLPCSLAKTRTLDKEPGSAKDLPWWNFDGSSTGQAEGSNSDIYLKPVAIYKDPFMLGKNKLVMCETYTSEKKPTGNLLESVSI